MKEPFSDERSLEQMIADGDLIAPTRSFRDFLSTPPIEISGPSSEEILNELREERLAFPQERTEYVGVRSVSSRGVLTLPASLRRKYGLNLKGARLEVIDRDGEIILRPVNERGEKQADREFQAGEGVTANSGEEFLDSLDSSS